MIYIYIYAGVMLAASYWSLLAPSIQMAEEANYGDMAFFPAACGFTLGALFVWVTDYLLPDNADNAADAIQGKSAELSNELSNGDDVIRGTSSDSESKPTHGYGLRKRSKKSADGDKVDKVDGEGNSTVESAESASERRRKQQSWRRILLLVIAVTIHNFPEGLAVGVGFGAAASGKTTFESARMIAIGIGIQNFPEGLAVALPLRRLGYSKFKCFWYGQLSGMVEPLGGVLGAYAVMVAEPILPYALAFAAGAMVFVVVDSLVPEVQTRGNKSLASLGTVVGFVVMMVLDVALG
jgi:zinc transporter 11